MSNEGGGTNRSSVTFLPGWPDCHRFWAFPMGAMAYATILLVAF